MSKEISKSPEMLQKEAQIKELLQQIKKERTTLKRLQTRLKNTKQEITEIQRSVSNAVFNNMDKMEALRAEVLALLKTCKKFKGNNNLVKEQIEMLIDEMEEVEKESEFDFSQTNKKNREDPEFEEEQRAKMRDMFQQFHVKPAEEEQKNIRKVFINLSTNFHPDKARNDKDRKDYHSLMQQINEAYQSGDIDKLLKLEKIYLADKVVDFSNTAVTVDMLTQEIDRLGRDLNFIKNQTKRTSAEIKALRKSELGNMLTDINRAEKEGMGLDSFKTEMDNSLEHLTELREVLLQCVSEENINPLIQMVEQQMSFSPLDFMEGLDMNDEEFSMMSEFFDDFDDYPEPVKNPKIPIGSSVQIIKDIPLMYTTGITLKGWQGRISEVYQIDQEIVYVVQLDSITLRKIPNDLINNMIDDEEEFNMIEVSLGDLKKVPPRDTPEEMTSTYRTIFHGQRWGYLSKKDRTMMQKILLKFPEKSDEENWTYYLNENLLFPFNGKSRGYYNGEEGEKMTVVKVDEWHEDGGLLVLLKENGQTFDHPLFDIYSNGKHEKVIELYHEWFETVRL